jgi:hypothetical protein
MTDPDQSRRRGRPPFTPSVRRDRRVVTFLTEHEFNQLSALATENCKTLSATAHRLIELGLASRTSRSG